MVVKFLLETSWRVDVQWATDKAQVVAQTRPSMKWGESGMKVLARLVSPRKRLPFPF